MVLGYASGKQTSNVLLEINYGRFLPNGPNERSGTDRRYRSVNWTAKKRKPSILTRNVRRVPLGRFCALSTFVVVRLFGFMTAKRGVIEIIEDIATNTLVRLG